MYRLWICAVSVWLLGHLVPVHAQPAADMLTQAGKPRVLVTSDINNAGADPDDKQSMAHLFMHANAFNLVGVIPDRWGGRNVEATMQVVDAYAQDYNDPSTRYREQGYPTPEALRGLVQTHPDSARQHLIEQARAASPSDPLYVLDPNHDLDRPSQSSWAGRFTKPFPGTRPHYWTGIDGGHAWNYAAPCATWTQGAAVYNARVHTLLRQRGEMYAAWLKKLNALYPPATP